MATFSLFKGKIGYIWVVFEQLFLGKFFLLNGGFIEHIASTHLTLIHVENLLLRLVTAVPHLVLLQALSIQTELIMGIRPLLLEHPLLVLRIVLKGLLARHSLVDVFP